MQRLLLTLLNLAFGAALIVAPSLTNIGSGSMYDSAFADKGGNGKGGGNNGGNGKSAGNGSGISKGADKAKHAKAPKKRKAALNAGHASAAAELQAAPDADAATTAAQRLLTNAQAALNAALADPMFDLATFPRLEHAVANAQAHYARAMNNATAANQAAENALQSRH